MSEEPYLGEIRLFSFDFAPADWELCNGQVISISQNQALFSLIGTTFGGDGRSTFALPDLRGRVPVHVSEEIKWGEVEGEEMHALTMQELPKHNHQVYASSQIADQPIAKDHVWAKTEAKVYSTDQNITMNNESLSYAGGNAGHNNMQPYIVANYCIATKGIFPPRN
ncbi:phage tail protein [Filobacillus milosensis]|uniref:Phage tail protein n=1 Tax=Filobacillus milosensis TaxID=94137 RepID=A0A4Y8ILB9_9BACI|nr:tail fiber protein [Filobacillus milosensis]TFB14679.1 phage tail protein [Filobacillus milosensis]